MSQSEKQGSSNSDNHYSKSVPNVDDALTILYPMKPRWYELFLFLGVDREVLEECCQMYPCDDQSSLTEAISRWLSRKHPLPSWHELADVVENVLLEGELARVIRRKYCLEISDMEAGQLQDLPLHDTHVTDHDGVRFKDLLESMAERLGSNSFCELQHFLLNLKCPDGSNFIDLESLYRCLTVPDLLNLLVKCGLCIVRDVDVLIHVVSGLKRQDILSLISAYVPNISIGSPIQNENIKERDLMVTVLMHSAIKTLDLGIVSAVKHDLCTCFCIQDQPFLMQYIGWRISPVTLVFKLPILCLSVVERGLQSRLVKELRDVGVQTIKIHINGTFVTYNI